MSPFQYLSEEWRAEAERRLKAELTPERMNNITSSMSNIYEKCPDGKTRYLFFKFENGALAELRLGDGEPPEADFRITGDLRALRQDLPGRDGSAEGAHDREAQAQGEHGQGPEARVGRGPHEQGDRDGSHELLREVPMAMKKHGHPRSLFHRFSRAGGADPEGDGRSRDRRLPGLAAAHRSPGSPTPSAPGGPTS